VIEANETALRFGGFYKSDVIGKPFWKCPWWRLSPETQIQLKDAIKQASKGEFVRYQVDVAGKKDRVITIDFSLKPIIDETGRVYLLIPEGRDITERKIMEEKLEKAKEEAEEANKIKSQILSFVSHDFKNPLNSIIGYSQMLEQGNEGSLTQKQEKYIHNINTSANNLLVMVLNVLDAARIESGQIPFLPKEIEIEPLLEEIHETLAPIAQDTDVQVFLNKDKNVSKVIADPVHLKQIIYNLLSNGIKYNHSGGKVILTLSKPEERHCLVGQVHDTGIGISKENISKLFKQFYRVDSPTSRKTEGTGLGLPIVKKLVELQGGDIQVDSELGTGSTFTFTLPQDIAIEKNPDRPSPGEFLPDHPPKTAEY
jgi:PAS domain S-box-containing protein